LANVSSGRRSRNNSPADETIFCFWRRTPETPVRYQTVNKIKPSTSGGDADRNAGDSQMRTLSFILAFAFMMAGPSMAGSADNGLPGIGTFSYNGSPISAPTLMAAN
jgi:hypothetical protein